MSTKPLELRIIDALRPSFRESISIRAGHWAMYNNALDELECIFTHETKEQAIKLVNKLISCYPSSSSNSHAYVDVASCLIERGGVEYQNVFKF